uniref:DWNN domain-containing protein n=1 Tax=Fundulus heteroclitus TaxID=8078 RepID=A0A3Q2NVV8_FUNHE
MAHIHYKFSSKLSYDTVVFDGPHISLDDLKKQIMGREKLRAGDCDLQITNAQTKEEFTEDCHIPKGCIFEFSQLNSLPAVNVDILDLCKRLLNKHSC